MSRLDSAIRRLAAQRDCLESAAGLVRRIRGHVLELGLGNGRTYDHLRALLPNRKIFVFDRQVAAHPSCVPSEPYMILGNLLETLPTASELIDGGVALVHNDIGGGNPIENRQIADRLPRLLAPLLAPGSVVVSDQDLGSHNWVRLPLPTLVASGRYHMWRVPPRLDGSGP